jgi:hypothetical protein
MAVLGLCAGLPFLLRFLPRLRERGWRGSGGFARIRRRMKWRNDLRQNDFESRQRSAVPIPARNAELCICCQIRANPLDPLNPRSPWLLALK